MSSRLHPAYRFATEAQWQACHFTGADRRTAAARKGMRPFAPFALPPDEIPTGMACAPAIGDESELIWRDNDHHLWMLPFQEKVATYRDAPAAIGSAVRLVAASGILWAVGEDGDVNAFDAQTLARLFQTDLGDLFALDIASDSSDGVYVLGRVGCETRVVHLGCAGNLDQMLVLEGIRDASKLIFLGIPHRLAVLASADSKLHFVDAKAGRPIRILHLAALRGCFKVDAIGGDGCSRFFIAGTDRIATNGPHWVLILDGDGVLLGSVPVGAEVNGIAATRSELFLTTAKGVMRFEPASAVPQGMGEVEARVITPQLRSPTSGSQKWIRVDAKVNLPAGCSIRISHASTSDAEKLDQAEAVLADSQLTEAQRHAGWRDRLTFQSYTYHGDGRAPEDITLSAPLHDVREDVIWIEVALIAAPGGKLPSLSELRIFYPGATLLDHLPSIYRAGEMTPGDFTRALVGVLEAGTQELDEKIGKLGQIIHPKSADGIWLDHVASWLGLPWDNGLSVEQKRRIVSRGASIIEGYSTRSGLEELLECLIPDKPRRFRVIDMTADFGLATIAGRGCEGSRLPAVLAGLPATATELGNKAILGKARLPCGDAGQDYAHLSGRIRIDIAATDEERADWSMWLASLVQAMVPAAVTAEIRWHGSDELRGARIDENSKIEEEPVVRLGSHSVTGSSRLGGRARTILPSKLTRDATLQ